MLFMGAGLIIRMKNNDSHKNLRAILPVPLSVIALILLSMVLKDKRFMLSMPALVNLVLLWSFGLSLRDESSMIERFARMQNPKLTNEQVTYCRNVTRIWCVFFVFNGGIAALLALAFPIEWWALFTGFLTYVFMGLMFASEYIFRKYRFREYGTGPQDRLLKAIFPPNETL